MCTNGFQTKRIGSLDPIRSDAWELEQNLPRKWHYRRQSVPYRSWAFRATVQPVCSVQNLWQVKGTKHKHSDNRDRAFTLGEVLKELASCGLSKLRPAFIKFHMYRNHRSVHPSLCFVARAKRVQRSSDSTWFDSACFNAPIWKTMSGAYPLSSFPQETVFNLSG